MSTNLAGDLNVFRTSELSKLSSNAKFLSKVESSIDKILMPVAANVYNSASADLNTQTSLTEDHNTFISMIKSAIGKSADPSTQTDVSDSVNRNTGTSVGLSTGSQENSDLISTIANRAKDAISGNLSYTPEGGFGTAKDSASDIFDPSKKLQQKVINSFGVGLTNMPDSVPQLTKVSLDLFSSRGTELNLGFNKYNVLVDSVRINCTNLDVNFYTGPGAFERTSRAKPYLETADSELVAIRNDLTYTDIFNEARYTTVRESYIKQAAYELVNYGGPNNRVAEIKGAMNTIDYLIAMLNMLYDEFYKHLNQLINTFEKFLNKMLFKGPMLAMLNHVQAEVRSMIRSMDAAITKGEAWRMPVMERIWYMELLVLYHKMYLTPQNVVNYFNTDPHGYISAYAPISSGLSAISLGPNLSLLMGQMRQYKYWVQRRLEDSWPNNPVILTNINNLSSQMTSDNTSKMTQISNALIAASGYNVPVSQITKDMVGMLDVAGMDRAKNAVLSTDWDTTSSLTPSNASTRGDFAEKLGEAVAEAEANPKITFNALAGLSNAQRYVLNMKRADDLLSSIQDRFKEDGEDGIVDDMNEIQEVCAQVERYNAEANA